MCRRAKNRTAGWTLIEMTLVVATVALLVGFAAPAVRSLMHSFHTEGGVRSMINAALSSARTMAVSQRRYVGVRFQKLCTSSNAQDPLDGLLEAPQYMIFIMHDPAPAPRGTDLADGFRVVEGLEPVKLPQTMGVMDIGRLKGNADIDDPFELSDATTFSIVFAPSGKLIAHDVRVRNKYGAYRPSNPPGSTQPSDDVFNSVENICLYQRGMFLQDDYSRRNGTDNVEFGLGRESSCTSFVIYDLPTLRAAYGNRAAWTGYLNQLAAKALFVSPYAGNLISAP